MGLSLAISMSPTRMIFCAIGLRLLLVLSQRGFDETAEQRMAVAWGRGELRVELAGDEPWMIRRFNHFDQRSIGGATGNLQAGFDDLRQQVVVHFVTMTVTLDDHILAVAIVHFGARLEQAFLSAEAHGAAQIGRFGTHFDSTGGVFPLGDQTDNRMAAGTVELASFQPSTLRANSMTATCMPRQMPRYGTLFSRAY
jgi:hypothetical protein